jgi:hypothetical protein
MDLTAEKRMGDSVGKPFVIALGDEGSETTGGRGLPVYTMGCGAGRAYEIADEGSTYQSSRITQMAEGSHRGSRAEMAESSIE